MTPAVLPIFSGAVLSAQTDERLLVLSGRGHERAFEVLVQRYRKSLLSYCRRRLLDEGQADDVVQQALMSAWTSLRNGTEVRDVKSWLYRIVHNTALNSLRSARYDLEELNEALQGDDAPEHDLDRRIAVRQALAGLAALPELQREALLRTAVEGQSHAQVAADLGVSDTVLRGLVYRARVSVRAAASALTPPPLVAWAAGRLASGGGGAVGQLAPVGVSSGGAGVALLLAKSGAIVVGAGALVFGGEIQQPRSSRGAVAHTASARAASLGFGAAAATGPSADRAPVPVSAANAAGLLIGGGHKPWSSALVVDLAPRPTAASRVASPAPPPVVRAAPVASTGPTSDGGTPSGSPKGTVETSTTSTGPGGQATTVQNQSSTAGSGSWTASTSSSTTSTTTTASSGAGTGSGSTTVATAKSATTTTDAAAPPTN